jgi:hypothetical protein
VSLAELRGDVVILACAVSAGIHAALMPVHLAEGSGAGIGFAIAAVVLTALVVALTREPTNSRALGGAALVFAGLLASYALAVTTGLPVLHPEPEAFDRVALGTKAIEVVGLLAAASVVSRPRAVGKPIPLLLTAMIGVFSGLAAVAVSGGHHAHSHASTEATDAHRPA